MHQPAPGEQPRAKTSDGLCADVDRELLGGGRRHRRREQHHGVVFRHHQGVRSSSGKSAGSEDLVATIARVEVAVASDAAFQFWFPAPGDQFPTGDADTLGWDHGFKRLLIFFSSQGQLFFSPHSGSRPQRHLL